MAGPILIFGTSVLSQVVQDSLYRQGTEILGYLGDIVDGESTVGVDVAHSGSRRYLTMQAERLPVFVAIGNNANRKRVTERLRIEGFQVTSILDPNASISRTSEIGEGCYIGPNVCIGPNSRVGMGSILYPNTVLNHDNDIGSWSSLGPGCTLAGRARAGSQSSLGSGVLMLEGSAIEFGARVEPGRVIKQG